MKLYPVSLKLEGQSCLVIGGGSVALRKTRALLEAGARVSLVSPEICPGLARMAGAGKVFYKKSFYESRFLRNNFLVIAATDDAAVNAKISREAARRKMLVNVVDCPEYCNFYVPSVLRGNDLSISIASGGVFAGLSKKIKNECRPVLAKYAGSLKTLAFLREQIKSRVKNPRARRKLIQGLLEPEVLDLINAKKIRNFKDLQSVLKLS